MVSVFYELHVIIANCSLIILPRQQKGTAFGRDVAPLGREVGVTGFARGAPHCFFNRLSLSSPRSSPV
jgi:hypothetical protein